MQSYGQMISRKISKSTNSASTLGLFLVAFCFSLCIHSINRSFVESDHEAGLRQGITVKTADDASYLRPVLNFLDEGTWKTNDAGRRAYVLRPPGYGLVYGFFVGFFGHPQALWAMMVLQVLLWSLAVSQLPQLGRNLGLSPRVSFFSAITVTVMPAFWGFLSYTLTEALTPSLVILFYVFFFRGVKGDISWLFGSALIAALIFLIRPALLVLTAGIIPFLNRRVLLCLLISMIPLGLWQWRVFQHTGQLNLHPIYHSDANNLYRPLHAAIWDFHKMTGQSGAEFHNSMRVLWRSAEGSLGKREAVEMALSQLPPSAIRSVGDEELRAAYSKYAEVLSLQVPYRQAELAITDPLEGEAELLEAFSAFRKKYVSDNPIRAWVLVPAEVFWELTFHSNLSLYIFQKPLRGMVLIEILRGFSLLIHFGSFVMVIFASVILFRNRAASALAVPILVYLAYLIFIQRGVEERYTLPFLVPAFYLALAVSGKILTSKLIYPFKQKREKLTT